MKKRHCAERILGILTAAVILVNGMSGMTVLAQDEAPAENKATSRDAENAVNAAENAAENVEDAGQNVIDPDLEYMPGELLVAYKKSVGENAIAQYASEQEDELVESLGETEDTEFALIDIGEEQDVEEAARLYEKDPRIEYAEPNYIIEAFEETEDAEDAESASAQWYLDNVKAGGAWEALADRSGTKVRVAVLDTGARLDHEDLTGSINQELSKELVKTTTEDGYVYSMIPLRGDGFLNGTDYQNDTTHGTHVAGIIAAQSGNGKGIRGVASGGNIPQKNQIAELVTVDVFTGINTKGKDSGSVSDVLEGLKYAKEQGCRIINLSLGTYGKSQSLEDMCTELEKEGIILVCAAGNDNTDAANYPSDYASTIAVVNIDKNGKKSASSNYGSAKDLSAPGAEIYSTMSGSKDAYGYLSGTSMSAPMVTATAAMMLYAAPKLDPAGVRKILCETATDLGEPGKDDSTGYGALNAQAAVESAVKTASSGEEKDDHTGITYRVHVQSFGWQSWLENAKTAGTVGQQKRIEALELKLTDPAYSGEIRYQTHVQSYGWQPEKSDGETSGTIGQAKRVEAIRIRLTGEIETHYDIYYRVHAQTYGWLGWAKNGETAGTEKLAKRAEAIEIRLVPKGGEIQEEGNAAAYIHPLVEYQTHVQTYGWQASVRDGQSAGTVGQAKRLEGLKISLPVQEYEGDVKYRTHVQTYGWQPEVTNGKVSGTAGQAKRLEAVEISLTGEMETHYDIYYRVHAQTYGWLGWAKNGEPAGTEGMAKRLEAIEIRLVEKGGAAPGSTEHAFYSGKDS